MNLIVCILILLLKLILKTFIKEVNLEPSKREKAEWSQCNTTNCANPVTQQHTEVSNKQCIKGFAYKHKYSKAGIKSELAVKVL